MLQGQQVRFDGAAVVRNATGVPVAAADGDARVFAVRRIDDGEFDRLVDQFRVDGSGEYLLDTDRLDPGVYALSYRGTPVRVTGGEGSTVADPVLAAFAVTDAPSATETQITRPDDGDLPVPSDGRLQVTGTTELPPGTQLVVSVRSTGETQPRYVVTERATVGFDGSYVARLGLPARPQAGDTARVTVSRAATGPTGGAALVSLEAWFVSPPDTTTLPPPLSLSPPASTATGTGGESNSSGDPAGEGLVPRVGPLVLVVPLGAIAALLALTLRRG
jgi:hypothetical protein